MTARFVRPRDRRWLWLALAATAVAFVHPQQPIRAQVEPSAIRGQSVTKLPDGRELLLGGSINGTVLNAAWIRNPQTGDVVAVSGLTQARAWHTATLLPDGTVLVLGGLDARRHAISQAEHLNLQTGTWRTLPELQWPARAGHSATLINGQHLMAAGGIVDDAIVDEVDLIDVQTWTVTALDALTEPRAFHTARLLADGTTALSGGQGPGGRLASAGVLIDPITRTVQDMTVPKTDEPFAWLAASDPEYGATNVGLQPRITLRLTRPARVETANSRTVALSGPSGAVETDVVPAEEGRLLFLTPRIALEPNGSYLVTVDGLLDAQNTPFPTLFVAFSTAPRPEGDASRDDELWDPLENDGLRAWRSNRPPSSWQQLPPLKAPPGVTALSGQVLRLNGAPLAGVTLTVQGRSAITDSTGRFLIVHPQAPTGWHELWMDGRTANGRGSTYGTFEVAVRMTAGTTSVLPYTIWMPKLDTVNTVKIPSPTRSETVVTTPKIPGLELHLPPGTVISDEDGRIVREVSITPIPVDRTPFPLPVGVNVPIYFTVQPGGAYVAVTGASRERRGARLIYPNYRKRPAGAPMEFWHYQPDEGRGWYVYGRGAVTKDGQQVVPDPGVSLYEFTGAMVGDPNLGGGGPPLPPGGGPWGGDPVHLGTGQFILNYTDLALPDVLPIGIRRTYRTNDAISRSFGLGATHQYDMFLVGTTFPYTYIDLVLPDGVRVHYERISPGTGYTDAIYEHTSSPTGYFKSKISWNGNGWNLDLKDGSRITFADGLSASRPSQAAATGIQDRYGNAIVLTRDSSANLTRITSPNGRWIELTYDTSYRVTQARDHVNRLVQYTYDTSGRLWKVTNPGGGVTEYTYDTSHRMLTLKDARGITFLTNEYDTNGRVIKQTQADLTTFEFDYTLDGSGFVTQTDLTDLRGYIRRATFNAAGYLVTDTHALGEAQERTYTNEWQTGTNLLLATIDPLNRRTEYTYDSKGNVTSETRLAGTTNAVTESYTYESAFQQLASVTDPLNHTTTLTHDSSGSTTAITDPLSHQTTLTYNASGQPLTVTTAAGTTQFAYEVGDLVTVTDPVGATTTRFYDAVGRLARVTNPLGQATRYEYDVLNRVTNTIDALGGETTLTYDANGNLLTLTDALNHTTTYTYNNMDRVTTRTDPLSRGESYEHDENGNLEDVTDRKSQVTSYTYDALNRLSTLTYDDSSTTTRTYDAGDRLTQVVDSIAGTITRTWDLLDRLTEETTPEGTINYTYDAADRRATMTVSGQPQVSYAYDNANRLTSITQNSSTVGFAYDTANRRTMLTLPNGVTVEYGYDNASHMTSLTYKLGTTTLGDLAYSYDLAGNRTTVGGSWARTGLPNALSSATYDAANQIATWAATSFSHDANGNLTNGGAKTYAWNARDQLIGLSGGANASFAYDGLGRRREKTISGTATKFLYDGLNFVQEQSSAGTPTANLLTGLDVDETFTRSDASGTRTLLLDGLGSTLALTDASGAVQTQYTFEPFGATSTNGPTSTNTQQYSGRENDGSGLFFFRARYYSAQFARFVSQDPIGLIGGPNVFAFVTNNPIVLRDPLGLQARSPVQGQPPNSTQWHPNPDGSITRRYFGPDGRAVQDVDFGQRHGYDPEVHWWDWTKDRPRQPGQPYPKELPPGRPPAPPLPLPSPFPTLLPPWMVPLINPCLLEPMLCKPLPSKTWTLDVPRNDSEPRTTTELALSGNSVWRLHIESENR